ncbi:hypothetical protein ROU88_02910 [Macrococcus capreoli]
MNYQTQYKIEQLEDEHKLEIKKLQDEIDWLFEQKRRIVRENQQTYDKAQYLRSKNLLHSDCQNKLINILDEYKNESDYVLNARIHELEWNIEDCKSDFRRKYDQLLEEDYYAQSIE